MPHVQSLKSSNCEERVLPQKEPCRKFNCAVNGERISYGLFAAAKKLLAWKIGLRIYDSSQTGGENNNSDVDNYYQELGEIISMLLPKTRVLICI